MLSSILTNVRVRTIPTKGSDSKMKLSESVAIVTGAGSGIGRAIALRLAEVSCKVVVADFDEMSAMATVDAIRDLNRDAIAVIGDVSKQGDAQTIVAEAMSAYGAVHILVNSAGIMANASVMDETPIQWNRILDVNLTGAFMMSKYAVAAIKESGGGSIVNIGSILGIQGAPQSIAYTASKGGIIAITRALAAETASLQIRVNCISPGTIDTPLVRGFLGREAQDVEKALAQMISLHPLGRIGTPRDVANAALWLVSEESSFVTGINLVVDGGRTIATVQPRGI